jgi:hypothetical protein
MSTIPPISTKRTISYHLNSVNIKETATFEVVNPGSGLVHMIYSYNILLKVALNTINLHLREWLKGKITQRGSMSF